MSEEEADYKTKQNQLILALLSRFLTFKIIMHLYLQTGMLIQKYISKILGIKKKILHLIVKVY